MRIRIHIRQSSGDVETFLRHYLLLAGPRQNFVLLYIRQVFHNYDRDGYGQEDAPESTEFIADQGRENDDHRRKTDYMPNNERRKKENFGIRATKMPYGTISIIPAIIDSNRAYSTPSRERTR